MMGTKIATLLLFLCLLNCFAAKSEGAKILSVFGFPGPSQYIYVRGLLKALAERGHNVTSITVFPQKENTKNFNEIGILENLEINKERRTNLDDVYREGFISRSERQSRMGSMSCEYTLKNAAVQQLMRNDQFDLVIVDTFMTEALFGLAQHFNAPLIGISTFGTISWIDRLVGNTSPVSYIPHAFQPFQPKMPFVVRLQNLLLNIFEHIHHHAVHYRNQRAIYNKYFPHAKLTFDETLKNFSLILLNQHFTLSYPRPYVPNLIEVGGLHVTQQPAPLPADMQAFLDNATDGAIYFSLGSNLKGTNLPAEKRQILLNTFAALKQKVLWKFEDADGIPDKPANVYIDKWFPQSSILAHPNVKVFISHGGWLSTTESVFHAKPILGIPMFGDQPGNVAKAVRSGMALSIDFSKLNEAEFSQKLHELLHNPIYTEAVQHLSRRFRDQPMTPLETAVYWTEYVLRQGGEHLRNASVDLNFWQYHSLDTIGTLLAGAMLVLVSVLWAVIKVLYWLCGKKQQHSKKKLKSN